MKFAALLLAASAPALAQTRLPRTVVPVGYDITVRPDAKAMTFTGEETVAVDVKEPTATVTLHAADLDVRRATFDGRAVPVALDAAAQTLTVKLPRPAAAGRHVLGFAWSGKINQSAAGLFATDYVNADGGPARMLATQFEATDGRRFAPMWDEPAFKAKFRLSAVAPAGQLAVSNMPVASVTRQGDGTQLYRFGESPLMSSYLLFLGMGDLQRKTVKAGNVEVGVVSRRGVVDQGDYALDAARKLLSYYNDYFGQPYPLPKLDMIAGPGSSQFFGAMENWGAIFYFENELLFDPKRATEGNRQRIHTVVAHEIAHQWFGDLVTMRWWDDLWLNEGFASWMEAKASNDLNPTWKADAQAVVGAREGAMGIDATAAATPIIRRIEIPDEISDAFDPITYLKGQAVIGMLEATLGEAAFRDGLRRYMARYRYGNTVTDQLWAELAAASGRPVADAARGFTTQAGVPLVRLTGARCENGRTVATLAQGRFGLDEPSKAPRAWRVPLVLATLGGGEARAEVAGGAMSVAVPGCGTLVLNRGKGSYARVMYDEAGHAAIVRDYAKLALTDRLGTMADDFALAAGGYQELGRWAAVVDRLGEASEPLEWSNFAGELGTLANLYGGTPLEAGLRALSVRRLGPVLRRIGFEPSAGESPLVSTLREALIGRLGASGDPEVVRRARAYAAALRTDPTAIPAAIRQPVLAAFAANATPADWDALLALATAEANPVAKNRYASLLGVSRDPANARRALELLRGEAFSRPQRAATLRAVSYRHPELAFDWAVANRALAEGLIEESSRGGFVAGLAAGSNDPATPAKLRAFAAAEPEGGRVPVERTLAIIAARRAAAERLRSGVERWVAGRAR